MILTFAQYHTLIATRPCATHEQLTARTEFDAVKVRYHVRVLLENGLVMATSPNHKGKTYYKIIELGALCVADYEVNNPALKQTPIIRFGAVAA